MVLPVALCCPALGAWRTVPRDVWPRDCITAVCSSETGCRGRFRMGRGGCTVGAGVPRVYAAHHFPGRARPQGFRFREAGFREPEGGREVDILFKARGIKVEGLQFKG